MFSVGDAYELFMGRWSRRLAPLLVRFAGVAGADRVLDVGSGTGALAAAAAAAAPSGQILGVDRSEPYVAFARAHQEDERVQFEVADAERLRFESGRFDRTLSLPIELDPNGIKAEYRDGLLALYLPRAESDKPRSIKIS